MHVLGFQAERGDGPGIEPGDTDGIAGFLAIAIGAIVDTLERGVDLGDQLALPVPRAQLERTIAFRAGPIGHIGMVLALFLQVLEGFAALAEDVVLPCVELGPEILPLPRVHERLVVTGPVFNHFCNRRHQQTQLQCAP